MGMLRLHLSYPLPLLLVPLQKPAPFKDNHLSRQRSLISHTHTHTPHSCNCTTLWHLWCLIRELKETVLTHCMSKAQCEDLSHFPMGQWKLSLLAHKGPGCLGEPKTGNLQSFLLHLGLCYHLLSFEMNIKAEAVTSHICMIALPTASSRGTHRKKQDALFICALKEQGSNHAWLSAHITTWTDCTVPKHLHLTAGHMPEE